MILTGGLLRATEQSSEPVGRTHTNAELC